MPQSDQPQLGSTGWRNKLAADILGAMGDVRLLWIPLSTDTTTSTTLDPDLRMVTWDATVAARLTAQGPVGGVLQSFNGTDQYGTMPDTANMSFTDDIFSVAVLANVTNTAADRVLFAKYNVAGTLREYAFLVNGTGDTLQLNLYDESTDQQPLRTSDAAITMGSLRLFSTTCTAVSAVAARSADITLYQNAAVIASTGSGDNALYAGMENTAATPSIGSLQSGVAPFSGSLGLTVVAATAWSAKQHLILKDIVNYYYGLSL